MTNAPLANEAPKALRRRGFEFLPFADGATPEQLKDLCQALERENADLTFQKACHEQAAKDADTARRVSDARCERLREALSRLVSEVDASDHWLKHTHAACEARALVAAG